MGSETAMLHEALAYLSQGFSIIPVHSPVMGDVGQGTGKKPLVEWEVYQDRLPTREEVIEWWTKFPQANIGIITGKVSNLVILDLDNDEDFIDVPSTRVAGTGSGYHFWFRYPERTKTISSRIKVKIDGTSLDVRADRAFVVAPPSWHKNGRQYEWFNEDGLAELPRNILRQLHRANGELKTHNYPQLIRGVAEGERNSRMTQLAGHYLYLGVPEDEVLELCLLINKENRPPLPADEIATIVQSLAEKDRRDRLTEQGDPAGHLSSLLDLALPPRGWLAEWVDYADPITESPKEFLFFCGLVALAASVGNRVWIPEEGNAKIFPNLWVTALGPSSISAKSTSINTIRRLLRDASAGEVKTPDTFSLEALQTFLSENPAALLIQDELGSFLMGARREYNQGTIELLTKLYDYHDTVERFTLKGGAITIREPALSFLSASTVEWFKTNLREADIRGGFVARIAFCYSTGSTKTIAWRDGPTGKIDFNRLIFALGPLTQIHSRKMSVSSAAREWYESWYRDRSPVYRRADLLSHFWGRYRTVAKKVSMLYELSWNSNAQEISVESMKLSTALADYHLACAEYLLSEEFVFNRTLEQVRRVEKFIQERKKVSPETIIKELHIDLETFYGKIKPNLLALGKTEIRRGKFVWLGQPDT